VPDQDGVAIAIQNLVQGDGVGHQRADPEAAVVGDRGRCIAAHERRDRVEPRLGQRGQQVPPGVGAVRKAVQAQRQRAPASNNPNSRSLARTARDRNTVDTT